AAGKQHVVVTIGKCIHKIHWGVGNLCFCKEFRAIVMKLFHAGTALEPARRRLLLLVRHSPAIKSSVGFLVD
ncbi:MAG TPA: hypothetical protein VHV08_14890, partial [Pirellulales bacterium]|nr:hypothetical protein [Pirellulales bacterium]